MFLPARRAVLATMLASPALAQAGADWRVGAIFPTASLLGDEVLRGLELALEDRAPLRPMRLIRAEAAEAPQATAEARRLIQQERCLLVFGSPTAPVALAVAQAAEALETPFVELATTTDALTERPSRWLVRAGPRATDFGLAVAAVLTRFLPGQLDLPAETLRVALLNEAAPSPESVAAACEARLSEAGMVLAERLSHAPRTGQMPAILARLRAAGVDVLLHAGGEGDAAALLRAMEEGGWRPRAVIGLGAGWGLLGRAPDGCLVLDVPPILTADAYAPGARPFAEAYQRRWGSAPRSGLSLAAFAGAREVLGLAANDRALLRAALAAHDRPEGALPNGWGWRLDERGQNQRAAPVLHQWQGGRAVAVWPPEAAYR